MQKSKAARTYDALRQLQAENPQLQGMNQAIDQFLRSARPGQLMQLHDLVANSETKEAALRTLAGSYEPR